MIHYMVPPYYYYIFFFKKMYQRLITHVARVHFPSDLLVTTDFVLIQFYFVTFKKIIGYKFFKPSMTFCCYGNKKPLATCLVRQ